MRSIFVSFFILLFSACAHRHEEACDQTRAALDVGSGKTRVLVAQVDVCHRKIVKVLFEDEQAVPYRDTLVNEKSLAPATMVKGKALLREYADKARSLGAKRILAVGTEVFRRAENGTSYISELSRDLQLNIVIIDQALEARIGHESVVVSQVGKLPKEFLVWDVGGASTQISAKIDGTFQYYFPPYGSVSFKDFVIKEVQRKKLAKVKSPNPLSLAQAERAEAVTLVNLQKAGVPEWLTQIVAKGAVKVYGVGGVHYYSVREQIANGKDFYTRDEVEAALQKMAGKRDEDIGGKYASSRVSDLVMILSVMKALDIHEIYPVKANLSEGLIFQ